jgi:hypothetical protein
LGFGGSIVVDASNLGFIRSVSEELWNGELYDGLFRGIEKSLTRSNIVGRLAMLERMGASHSDEIGFAAANFSSLTGDLGLGELPISLLSEIIGHPSLRLLSEDSLLGFVLGDWPVRCLLLEHVRIEFLSEWGIGAFISCISNSFECLTFAVWEKLVRRLALPVSVEIDLNRIGVVFPLREGSGLDGILSFLMARHGGHFADRDRGVIAVNASSVEGGSEQTLAQFEEAVEFYTKSRPNSWVEYDLKKHRVVVSGYSIRSRATAVCASYHNPRHWVLKGSLDGNSWVELDRQTNKCEH